ncbi:MAG: S9 family peptidase [Acidimicrobiales bacterium mtb01]|nr:S9 family peptidase [Actinomycetota bacterium]TEX46836.1 MAG: S9 family peptidase [Acidimicrobiales bacterium mtb01]
MVSPDGDRVVFLRSRGGSDPVNCLWVIDVATGVERLVADPKVMLVAGADDADLPPEEKARRERLREGAGGITSYATNRDMTTFCCALAGRLFVGSLAGDVRELSVDGPVFDPRLDPTGTRIAYVSGRALRIAELDGSSRELAGPAVFGEADTVSWGSAEFIAAEEMGRYRGYWWNKEGTHLAVCRADDARVPRWYIADPAHPERAAAEHPYPAAGTVNADVTLHVFAVDDSSRVDIDWDRRSFEYLATVGWAGDDVLFSVESRDQKSMVVHRATRDGAVREVWRDESETWVDLVPGSPVVLEDGRLAAVADRDGWKRLLVEGAAVTPASINVRSIVSTDTRGVVIAGNSPDHPEGMGAWRWSLDGSITALTPATGINTVSVGGDTVVTRRASISLERAETTIVHPNRTTTITSLSEKPLVAPRVTLSRRGTRRVPTALLLPRDHEPGTKLPVLMDPYGGPHAQRVVDSYSAHCTSQWFADQGFAVIVADGRGTPALGTDWERSVHLDLASAVLDDQVDALHAIAADNPDIDLTRVGIRGWSFGGYLAALAVMRRPDVFHAAVAGAPVTEWRLYDTHYTERYLGNPSIDPGPYDRTSLLTDAALLTRPLLLVHGLADDNVVAAHTLQLSSALLAAGKPHEVLPLSGVTHMTPQPVVAENLLLHQLHFLEIWVANRTTSV